MKKLIITSTVITTTILGAINIKIASANRNVSYQVPQVYSLAQNGAECGDRLESYLGLYQGKAVVINSPKRTSGELSIEIDRDESQID